MASKGIHRLTGTVRPSGTNRLILDDGDFRSVMEVLEFKVLGSAAVPVTLVMSTDPESVPGSVNLADNRQIGWVETLVDGGGLPVANPQVLIESGRLLLSDLFITNLSAGLVGYSITLKRKKVSAAAALVTILKEQAQDL